MKYKLSYYTIITDEVPEGDIRILFGTKTAKAFNIKSEYIDLLLEGKFSEVPFSVLEPLIDAEVIVPSDLNELEELTDKAMLDSLDTSDGFFQYTIMNTANCQLGCGYCGQDHINEHMTPEIVKLTLDRVENSIIEQKVKTLHISWFGGEPLMRYSRMKELNEGFKALCAKYDCHYSSHLVSNGLSLKTNVYLDLAKEFNCTSIEVTLDGVAEFHDTRRQTKGNEPTFDLIFQNLVNIANLEGYPVNGCRLKLRCNVDDKNREGVIPLIEMMAEHNLQTKIKFYTAPVYSWGNDAHLDTTKEEYAVREIDYLLKMYELGFPISPMPRVRDIVCSAVTPNYELIDPWGKAYNCTEIPLVPGYGDEFVIGDLYDKDKPFTNFEERPFVNWYEEIKDKNNGFWCTSCKIMPLCGGRCPKSWKEGIPPCPSMKFNMEDRLLLAYYALSESRNQDIQEYEEVS